MRRVQKKIAEENIQKAVKVATETAEVAASDGKAFCVSRVDVGLDVAAVREAVLKVLEQKVITTHFVDVNFGSVSFCMIWIVSFFLNSYGNEHIHHFALGIRE